MDTKHKTRISVLLLLTAVGAGFLCAYAEAETELRIYLPRQVHLEKEAVTVGDICVVRGDEESVVRAGAVSLGRLSAPTGQMVVSRAMIQGRLTGSGFDASDIEFTGAEKVTASRTARIIRSEKIIELAESFIKNNLSDKSICRYEVVRRPADFHLTSEAKKVELECVSVSRLSKNTARVTVSIFADGKEAARREVDFRLNYFRRKVVALRDISVGEVITKDNVKVTQTISSESGTAEKEIPYGRAAVRDIAKGSVVTGAMTAPVKREIIVKRNERVAVVYKRPGLLLSTVGKALEDGRAGDNIRVKTQIGNYQRIIYAKVKEDGSVEPLL